MFRKSFSKKQLDYIALISFGVIALSALAFQRISIWSLALIPIILLLHSYPQWKTAIFSLLTLTLAEILMTILITTASKEIYVELFFNVAINAALIVISSMFWISNARIIFTDNLTEAYNRNYLTRFFENENNRKNLTLQILDVDFFKKVNDTYGHLAGDYVLKEMVKLIQSTIRKTDIVVRLGGEEFIILSPNTSNAEGKNMANRLITTVANHKFVFENKEIPVTISMGLVTQCPDSLYHSDILIDKADQALYRAKENGRNQLQLA